MAAVFIAAPPSPPGCLPQTCAELLPSLLSGDSHPRYRAGCNQPDPFRFQVPRHGRPHTPPASASVSRTVLVVRVRRSALCNISWSYVVDNISSLCGAGIYVALASDAYRDGLSSVDKAT